MKIACGLLLSLLLGSSSATTQWAVGTAGRTRGLNVALGAAEPTASSSMGTGPLIIDLAGKFVLAWEDFGTDRSMGSVMGQLVGQDQVPLGQPFIMNEFRQGQQTSPSITALSTGGFAAAWQSYGQDESSWGIFGRIFSEEGEDMVGGEFKINTGVQDSQTAPVLVGLQGGGLAATWRGFDEKNGPGIYLQFLSNDGELDGAEIRLDGEPAALMSGPSMAQLSGGGDLVFAWVGAETVNADSTIRVHVLRNGVLSKNLSPHASEKTYIPSTSHKLAEVSVAALSNGDFVVAWDNGSNVYIRRFDDKGVAAGPELMVGASDVAGRASARVAALAPLANGAERLVVTYNDVNGLSRGQVYRVDLTGRTFKDGENFAVNSKQAYHASSVGLEDGTFLVAFVGSNGNSGDISTRSFEVEEIPTMGPTAAPTQAPITQPEPQQPQGGANGSGSEDKFSSNISIIAVSAGIASAFLTAATVYTLKRNRTNKTLEL
jgi:hypothetical protein